MNIAFLLHGLCYGFFLSVMITLVILLSMAYNPEIWLNDFPPDIRDKYGPASERTKRQKKGYNTNMKKVRVDVLLVERGLAESRAQAQRLVMAGQVRVDGQVVPKPASSVPADSQVEIERGPRFVSRGGEKLEAALLEFKIEVIDLVCADVGASTGGFSDCLLQYGAHKIYAIDVGHGILHWKLRQDPRVVVMERTNARHIEQLPEPVQFITIDASFISSRVLLPVVRSWFPSSGGQLVLLVKPQFEAGRQAVARGEGVIRTPEVHHQVLSEVLEAAQGEGYGVHGLMPSPLLGPKGNVEFLAYLDFPGEARGDLLELISKVVIEKE